MARFEEFWTVACDYRQYLWVAIMMLIFFLVLTLISLLVVEPGTGSYYIALLNLAMILGVGGVMLGMYYVCLQRQTRRY